MIEPSTHSSNQQPLKSVLPQKSEFRRSQPVLRSIIVHLWRLIVNLSNSTELRVWHTQDRLGNIWWSAYDPITKQSIHEVTEAQMRTWIEKRHHQHNK